MNGLSNGAAIGVSSSHLLGGGVGGGSSYGVDSSHFSSMTHHHPALSSQLTVIVPGENVKQVVMNRPLALYRAPPLLPRPEAETRPRDLFSYSLTILQFVVWCEVRFKSYPYFFFQRYNRFRLE